MRELAALRLVNRDRVSELQVFFDSFVQLIPVVVWDVLAVADGDSRLSGELHCESLQTGSIACFDLCQISVVEPESADGADLAVEDLDFNLLSLVRVIGPDRVRLRSIANLYDLVEKRDAIYGADRWIRNLAMRVWQASLIASTPCNSPRCGVRI